MTLSSDEDKKKLHAAIVEISNSMTRIEGERDLIKETVKDLSDAYQIPKKTISKIAKTYHKQNFSQAVAENEEFEELYEKITK